MTCDRFTNSSGDIARVTAARRRSGAMREKLRRNSLSFDDREVREELNHPAALAIGSRVRVAQQLGLLRVFERGDGEAFGRLSRIVRSLLAPGVVVELIADV